MKKIMSVVLLVAILVIVPAKAGISDWGVTAHVTYLEPDNLDEFRFKLDVPSGCPGGNGWYLFDARFWSNASTPQADRREIIKRYFTVVMAAKLSGQSVDVYGDNTPDSSSNCVIGFVNLH